MKGLFIVGIGVVIAVITVLFLTSPTFAHNNGYNPDRDGDDRVEVFKGASVGNLHGEWHYFQVKANRQLRNYVPRAPRLTRVYDRDRADVVIVRKRDWHNCAGQYNASAKPDEIRVGGDCHPGKKWFSHEMGHGYGEKHHDCTPFWKKRTASVAQLDENGKLIGGCVVEINGFGSHDIKFLKLQDWNETRSFSTSSVESVFQERELVPND